MNTGFTRDVVTDAKGEFVFPVVDPGQYRVDVTLQGFKKCSQLVNVSALQTAQLPPKLEVGGLQESVEVTAADDGVNVTSGGVTQNLQKEVLEMPNLNRYGFANATLMPAIQQSEERRETINASVAGNTSNRNAFYIDGAEATDPWRGWSPRQPVVDAFEEIVVNTAGATVDIGSNFGGTYNADLQVRHQPVPRQRLVLLPRQRPQRELLGQQPRGPRQARRPAEVLGRPGRRPDHQGQAVLLRDGQP